MNAKTKQNTHRHPPTHTHTHTHTQIDKQLLPIAWHPARTQDWCIPEDEIKIESISDF